MKTVPEEVGDFSLLIQRGSRQALILRRLGTQKFAGPNLPELEQSKKAVLDSLTSEHSQRAYKPAIAAFTTWYCSEPEIGFKRLIVVRYHSFLKSQSLSLASNCRTVWSEVSVILSISLECELSDLFR